VVLNDLDPFTAPRFTATGLQPAAEHANFADNIWNEGKPLLCSQITGGAEYAVPLHIDIPRTGGKGLDLLSEDFLQEYILFLYECFLSVLLPLEGYCCKLCPSHNPRRKNHNDRFSSVSAQRLYSVFLSIKNPFVQSLFTEL
jgi:hypothetical protein